MEPPYDSTPMEALKTEQKEDLQLADAGKVNSAGKPQEVRSPYEKAPIAGTFPDSKALELPVFNEPDQPQQPADRQIGRKFVPRQSDLQRFGAELVEIFTLAENKRRAKTELVAAQLKYNDACAAVEELKERTMSIFEVINRSECPDNDNQ